MSARCVHGLKIEEPCLKCALVRQQVAAYELAGGDLLHLQDGGLKEWVSGMADRAADDAVYGADFMRGVERGRELERARVRTIVLKFYGNDWNGTKCLEEIGE